MEASVAHMVGSALDRGRTGLNRRRRGKLYRAACRDRQAAMALPTRAAELVIFRTCSRPTFLQNFPFQANPVTAALFQQPDEPAFSRVKIFFRVDAPIDGEPALLWDNVEIRAATALAA